MHTSTRKLSRSANESQVEILKFHSAKWAHKSKLLCVSFLKRRSTSKVCTGLRYFQSVELSLNRSVIDVQELICRSHHVDPVGLAVLRIILCKRHSANVSCCPEIFTKCCPEIFTKKLDIQWSDDVYFRSIYGGIPEWPKGTDCKSAGVAFGGSNPPSPTRK